MSRATLAALALVGCELVAGIEDRTVGGVDGGTGDPGNPATFSQEDLEGLWTGRIGTSSGVQIFVEATGRATGSGFSGTWRIDDVGRVTGSGSVSAVSGSQLIVASATWRLVMSGSKQALSGTVDGAAPGLHDLSVSLTRSALVIGSGGRSGTGGAGAGAGTGGFRVIGGSGGRPGGSGGARGGGSGGATGVAITCRRPPTPLLTDFSLLDATGMIWGDMAGLWGVALAYGTGITLSTTGGTARITGTLSTYSGFGLGVANGCLDASAYSGLSFTLGGNVGPSGTLLLVVATRSNQPVDGTGPGLCVYTSEATKGTDCVPAQRVITVPASPGRIQLAWSDFSGGKPVAGIEPQGITGLFWLFSWTEGSPLTPVSVTLDDVGFW
jgi:hypothetical protein